MISNYQLLDLVPIRVIREIRGSKIFLHFMR